MPDASRRRSTDADGVRLVTWNRPDALNALNDELWDATRDALLGAQADPELRCVVLTGTGPRLHRRARTSAR